MTFHPFRPSLRDTIAMVLAVMMALPSGAFAQAPQADGAPAAAQTSAVPTRRTLRVIALAGNNGENDLQAQVMSPLAVQVLDQDDRPVAGIPVIFRFPLTGPTARFANGEAAQTVVTDAGGQARASGWMANSEVGPFAVFVTASRGSEQGTISIPMSNVPRVLSQAEIKRNRKPWWKSKWAKIAYIAGAAALAAGIAISATGSNDTVIRGVPGSPTVGGPQ